MAIQGYGIFHRLLKGHEPSAMGLKGSAGDVERWTARYNLARNFRGLNVEEFSEATLKGYNAFLQVFLTHSALERYLPLFGLTEVDLDAIFAADPSEAEAVLRQFFAHDGEGKLFEFLHENLNPRLRAKLAECRAGTCRNVLHVSSSIRHIFAHGHLTAHGSDIRPHRVAKACALISNHMLDFMETDFTCRLLEASKRLPTLRGAAKARIPPKVLR